MQTEQERGPLGGIRMVLLGVLIGAGAILPGVSGSVLAVALGVYRPLMEVLSHPRSALARHWRLLLWVGIGCCVGFTAFGFGLAAAYRASAAITVWFFIGLIVGTVPTLLRESGKEGRPKSAFVSLFLCGLAALLGLIFFRRFLHVTLRQSVGSFFLCGVLCGLGAAVPGMTASPVMMALGLYQPLLEGATHLRMGVILPLALGFVLTVLLSARVVTWIFRRHYAVAYHGILGVVGASVLCMIPLRFQGAAELVSCGACCVAGAVIALYFSGQKV